MLIYVGIGFTIAHGLLSFLIIANWQLYNNISLHYSESFTWYFIFFLVPLLAGLTFYFWVRHKSIHRGLKILFSVLLIPQLAFTVIVVIFNYYYWGYPFKRPAVFHEILNVKTMLTCSSVSNHDSTGIRPLYVVTGTKESIGNLHGGLYGYGPWSGSLYGRKDFYDETLDRIFMVFEDRRLYDFPEFYKNPQLKASEDILLSIDQQIIESKIIDRGPIGYSGTYYDTLGKLNGIVTEFVTKDNVRYIFAGLSGQEVSNDHYPQYEFLFAEKGDQYKLIKKRRFYIDIAGIEGLEYANIAPFFSLLLTAIGLLGSIIIISTANRISKSTKRSEITDSKNNDP